MCPHRKSFLALAARDKLAKDSIVSRKKRQSQSNGTPLRKQTTAIVLSTIALPPNQTRTMCSYSIDPCQRPFFFFFYKNLPCSEVLFKVCRIYIFLWSIHFELWNYSRLFLFICWAINTSWSCFKSFIYSLFFALCEYFFQWPQWSHLSILSLNF